jgi:hypothetical protein
MRVKRAKDVKTIQTWRDRREIFKWMIKYCANFRSLKIHET